MTLLPNLGHVRQDYTRRIIPGMLWIQGLSLYVEEKNLKAAQGLLALLAESLSNLDGSTKGGSDVIT